MNITVTLFATLGMGRLLGDGLEGIRRVGIDPSSVVVIHTDAFEQDLVDQIRRIGAEPICVNDLVPAANFRDDGVYSDYGTATFNRFMMMRMSALHNLIRSHEAILVADLDIAWFKNPMPYLEKVLRTYAWTSQTEAVDLFPAFCAGFFAFRDCEFSRRLLEAVIARGLGGPELKGDQEHLNDVLADAPELMQSIFPLPEALFPNGLLTGVVLDRMTPPLVEMAGRLDPFIYHANFTKGLANKIKLLATVGALDGRAP